MTWYIPGAQYTHGLHLMCLYACVTYALALKIHIMYACIFGCLWHIIIIIVIIIIIITKIYITHMMESQL